MTYGSICSGIEAATTAWHPLGWTPAFFAEIEPFPCAVLAHHYPDVPNLGDMTTIDADAWRGRIDLLVGGTPCQAFSVVGLRNSLADARGNLTLKFVELVHGTNPAFVVWENVPGVLSTKDNAFGCFLAVLVGSGEPLVSGDETGSWPSAGMVAGPTRTAAWRILDAQYFGLAQRRRRVFVVSCRTGDGTNPGAILFEPESLPGDSAPSREMGAGVAGTVAPGAHAGSYNGQDAYSGSLISHSLRADGFDASEDGTGRGTPITSPHDRANPKSGNPCHTLSRGQHPPALAFSVQAAHRGVGQGHNTTYVPNGMAVRRLTPRECERLQGFPDDYTLIQVRGKPAADGPRYRALGNSMAVPVMRWIGKRIEVVVASLASAPSRANRGRGSE